MIRNHLKTSYNIFEKENLHQVNKFRVDKTKITSYGLIEKKNK